MTQPPYGGQYPHPEDDPHHRFNQNEPFDYSYGYQPYPGGAGENSDPSQPMVVGSGSINVMRAVSWAVGRVLDNMGVWVLGTLLLGIAYMIIAFPATLASIRDPELGDSIMSSWLVTAVSALVSALLTVFLTRGTLWQVDQPKMKYGYFLKDVNFGPAFIAALLISLLSVALGGFSEAVFGLNVTASLLGSFMAVAATILIYPLVVFAPRYLVERRATTLGEAFGRAFDAARRNYGRLLAYYVLAGIAVSIIALFTLGLGLLFAAPALYLAESHMYRQAAGAPIPYDSKYDGPHPSAPGEGYFGFA